MLVRSRLPLAILLLCAAATVPAGARAQARYLPSADTLRYESYNPYRMYWLRGADTLGRPVESRSVESHVWRGGADRPEVVIRQQHLDYKRGPSTDTFTVSPQGRVLEINHRPPTGSQRIDLLLRLPAAPLAVGTRWTDTVAAGGMEAAGEQRYEVIRSYRVARMVDTLGSRVAEVAAEGTVRFRLAFWADSAAGRGAWIDVSGPVREEYSFDVTRGRLIRRFWTMDLRGRGVPPTGTDTVAAGLRSDEEMRLSDSPRARLFLAALPGADTSFTLSGDGNVALLHTAARAPGRVRAGMVRGDTAVGTASATFAGGRVTGYEATWAGSAPEPRTQRIVVRGGELVLSRAGRPDARFTPPAGAWAVAEPAMHEMLAPALLALSRDGEEHAFSAFRPDAERWETGTAAVEDHEGLVLVLLRMAGREDLLLFTREGDCLFAQVGGAEPLTRVPVGMERIQRVQAVLKRLNEEG
jgi:hypothetical protein